MGVLCRGGKLLRDNGLTYENCSIALLEVRRQPPQVYDRGVKPAFPGDVAAFILAGGKSSRMGTDKALLNFNGRTLLSRALDLAHAITDEVRIVGSREKFVAFAPVVEDVFPGQGPLGGIHAALRSSTRELNLMLAVDAPFLSPELLQYLIGEALHASEASVVVPSCNGHRQPLCAVYRREFADAAEDALLVGKNRIDVLFDVVKTRVIEEEELKRVGFVPDLFCNLNTPENVEVKQDRLRA
jgi:molybdopterin-guanine dinucleotide biosynthesis protein A